MNTDTTNLLDANVHKPTFSVKFDQILNLPGHSDFVLIHETSDFYIFSAFSEKRGARVTLKGINTNASENSRKLRHEWELLKGLNISGVSHPLALESCPTHGLFLVFPNSDYITLQRYLERRSDSLDLREFLEIAIAIVSILSNIHNAKIIHTNLTPYCGILVHPETADVSITNFSHALSLEREEKNVRNIHSILLSRDLAYLAPECTGRMNRSVDKRCDFYSLGVIFYEILTHALPFTATDPLELVHQHIAQQSQPPHLLNSSIPIPLSRIVQKLMNKTAEDRYQSADGLKADLELLLDKLKNGNEELKGMDDFVAGEMDRNSLFIISQKLYGRKAEVEQLMEAFRRVNEQGITEFVIVRGYSGVGKSSLVAEIQRPVIESKGYFVWGKFDQYHRNVPFFSLIQASQGLIKQILSESPESLSIWKHKIIAALGDEGKVFTDVIPDAEKVIGEQPPIPKLGPAESEVRLNKVFQRFVKVFSSEKHPLIIFLDDLQWCTPSELTLIMNIISNADSQRLMIIGAYRDNEMPSEYSLLLSQEISTRRTYNYTEIHLHPLGLNFVEELIRETLGYNSPERNVTELSEIVYSKTQGNPFFVIQLLKSLYQENFLQFNFETKQWEWSITAIREKEIAPNIVDLLVGQIQKLSPAAQNVLKIAACLGNKKFTSNILSAILEKSDAEVAQDLWVVLQQGFVLPGTQDYKCSLVCNTREDKAQAEEQKDSSTTSYRFLHDRVQQAAYTLIPPEMRSETHMNIGQCLLKCTREEDLDDEIFDIVNQLNQAIEPSQPKSYHYELAMLNWRAGRKASDSTAFDNAIKYLNIGKELLGEDGWKEKYELTLNLHNALIEALYSNGDHDETLRLIEHTLAYAKTPLDKSRMVDKQVKCYNGKGEFVTAIDCGLYALELYGYPIPKEKKEIEKYCCKMRKELMGLTIDEIANLGSRQTSLSSLELAAVDMLLTLTPPAYFELDNMLFPIIVTLVVIAVRKGNFPSSAYVYCLYGFILIRQFKDYETGYAYGKLAIQRAQEVDNPLNCAVFMTFANHIQCWMEPPRNCITSFNTAIRLGLAAFNLEYTVYGCTDYCFFALFAGESLESLSQNFDIYRKQTTKLRHGSCNLSFNMGYQIILNITSSDENDPTKLDGEFFSEEGNASPSLLFYLNLVKAFLFLLFGRPDEAIRSSKTAEMYNGMAMSSWSGAAHQFYTAYAVLNKTNGEILEEEFNVIRSQIDQFEHWANLMPSTFKNKHVFLQAEYARVQGNHSEAMDLYDESINLSKEHGFIHEAGLFNEACAKFYLHRRKKRVAAEYLHDAYQCYSQWGAFRKLSHMRECYADVFTAVFGISTVSLPNNHVENLQTDIILPAHSSTNASPDNGPSIISNNTSLIPSLTDNHSSAQQPGSGLDLMTAMRASLIISEELVLENLLTKLIRILVQAAGAEYAILILENNGTLCVVARGDISSIEVQAKDAVLVETQHELLPVSVINYVAHTREPVITDSTNCIFKKDPYICKKQPKSLLCTAIQNQRNLVGILYLENNLVNNAFAQERLEILKVLFSQAAISIEKSRLYKDLETANINLKRSHEKIEEYSRTLEMKVETRTLELQTKNLQLRQEVKEREQAEIELKKAKEVAEAATEMKSTFLATMSHEIRTPFNAVIGMTNLLLETSLTPIQQDYVETINESSSELLTIINDILDFSKIESGKLDIKSEPFSLRQCIEGALGIVAEKAMTKGLELAYLNDSEEDMIIGDLIRLRQIVLNLLSNAVKLVNKATIPILMSISSSLCHDFALQLYIAGLAGELFAIYCEWFTRVGQVVITANLRRIAKPGETEDGEGSDHFKPSHELLVSVADSGKGIPKEKFDRLFKAFSQVEDSAARFHVGTGLGLAISERLCQIMGGRIWMDSTVGMGSTFYFTIPTKTVDSPETTNTYEAADLQNKKCLIVYNHAAGREALMQHMKAFRINAETISTARELESIISKKQKTFDLIILDCSLPDMELLAAISLIRKFEPNVNILVAANIGFNMNIEAFSKLKIKTFVRKPVKRNRLYNAIRELYPSVGALITSPGTPTNSSEKVSIKHMNPNIAKDHPLKILVAEDNVVNRKVAVEILRLMGYEADVVDNGIEAINAIEKHKYDVCLMDVNMPKMDGLTATRTICAAYDRHERPRIIAMTANAMHGDKDECLKAGCDDYVAKPILVAELVNALKKCQARTHTMSSSLKRGAASYNENDELADEEFTVTSSVSNQNAEVPLLPNRKKPRNF